MKFKDLKEQIQSGNTNFISLINFNYVPLASQQNIVDNIIAICLNKDENGFIKVDFTLKSLFKSLYLLANYTDIEFEDLYDAENNIDSVLAIEFYDFCKEHKIIEFVELKCDLDDFNHILEDKIKQEIEINNSVASILSQVLNKIALKLPAQGELGELMKGIPSILANFNKSTKPSKKTPTPTPRKTKA